MVWRLNPNIRSVPRYYRKKILDLQGGICAMLTCKRDYKLGIHDSETDHIIPWNKGGRSVPENLRVLCKKCHIKESNFDYRERWVNRFYKQDYTAILTLLSFK
jgi:5-methylcytosine-specific restriction endonuclease McrA